MNHFSFDKGFFRSMIYPDRCCLCGKVISYSTELCDECFSNEALIVRPVCHSCGKSKKDCTCNGKANFYQGITAPYMYKGRARNGIILWKFHRYYRSVSFFAKRIVSCVKNDFGTDKIDVITFVPQTQDESDEKTFNQCEALAVEVANQMHVPVEPLLTKIAETMRQHDMPFYLKSGNVFGAFNCNDTQKAQGRNILLVDDIKTSGNTLNECAKMLHLSGAATVYCAVIGVK